MESLDAYLYIYILLMSYLNYMFFTWIYFWLCNTIYCISINQINQTENKGQRVSGGNSTAGNVLGLNVAHPGLIPSIPCGSWASTGLIPECIARSKPWALLGGHKQI